MTNNVLGPNVGLPIQPARQEPGWTSSSFKRWLVENLRAARKCLYADLTGYPTLGLAAADLQTYNLPANLLGQQGEGVYIHLWGVTAANVNNKTLSVLVDATQVFTSGAVAANNTVFDVEVFIFRKSGNTQEIFSRGLFNNAAVNLVRTAGAFDLTAAHVVHVNATTPTSAGDLTLSAAMIEKFDQPNLSGIGGVS